MPTFSVRRGAWSPSNEPSALRYPSIQPHKKAAARASMKSNPSTSTRDSTMLNASRPGSSMSLQHPPQSTHSKSSPSMEPQSDTHPESTQNLVLDLDGLDLGGCSGPSAKSSFEERIHSSSTESSTIPFGSHLHSQYGGNISSASAVSSPCVEAPILFRTSSDYLTAYAPDSMACCDSEDSFAAHLRSECANFHEIMSSHVILHRAESEQSSLPTLSTSRIHPQENAENKQVLGGFASLGLTSVNHGSSPQLVDSQSLGSEDNMGRASNQYNVTPEERLSLATMHKWTSFTTRPSDPLATLDIMSINEMGQHSVDVGNVHEWQGNTLSAEVACSCNATEKTKLEWSIAKSQKPKKKWVVVPGANGDTAESDSDSRGHRTVIVSERPLWVDHESDTDFEAPSPFSGWAGYEFKLLRSAPGMSMPTVYLANPETHRIIHSFRNGTPQPALAEIHVPVSPTVSESSSNQLSQSVYPVLRRSRSRPYLRSEQRPLRRSRSKPYMRYSQKHQVGDLADADTYAPSLPGPPGSQYHPDVSWPSARRTVSPGSASTRTSSGSYGSHSSLDPVATTCSHTSTCGVSEAPSATSFDNRDIPIRKASTDAHQYTGSPDSDASQSNSFPGFTGSPFQALEDSTAIYCGKLSRSRVSSPSEASPRHSSSFQCIPAELEPCSTAASDCQSPRISLSETSFGDKAFTSEASSSRSDVVLDLNRLKSSLSRSGQRKDRRLSEWFKRKVGLSQSIPQFAGMPGAPSLVYSPPSLPTAYEGRPEQLMPEATNSSADTSKPNVALTRATLDQIDTLVDRAGSPESTIMGSRRGSEVVTQANVNEQAAHARAACTIPQQDVQFRGPLDLGALERMGNQTKKPDRGRLTMEESRQAVATSLARIYGWSEDVMALRSTWHFESTEAVGSSGKRRAPTSHFRNVAEMDSLLGLEKVAPEALTMLIPLPLVSGNGKVQATRRYLRVIFVPFDRPTPDREASPMRGPLSKDANVTSVQTQSQAQSQAQLALPVQQPAPELVGLPNSANGSSAWYRKLGLNSISRNNSSTAVMTRRSAKETAEVPASASKRSLAMERGKVETRHIFEAFRVSGMVLEACVKTGEVGGEVGGAIDAQLKGQLPPPSAFPIVLGFCNGNRGIEMVPEGWTALQLASEIDAPCMGQGGICEPSPLTGVADMIIAACAAIMGL